MTSPVPRETITLNAAELKQTIIKVPLKASTITTILWRSKQNSLFL